MDLLPLPAHLPHLVAIRSCRRQGLTELVEFLHFAHPQRTGVLGFPLAVEQLAVAAVELMLGGGQSANGRIELVARAARPQQDRDQAVDQNAQSGLFGTQQRGLEGIGRIHAAIQADDHGHEARDLPEVLAFGTVHQVGAEADEDRQGDHEPPAFLREQGDQGQ